MISSRLVLCAMHHSYCTTPIHILCMWPCWTEHSTILPVGRRLSFETSSKACVEVTGEGSQLNLFRGCPRNGDPQNRFRLRKLSQLLDRLPVHHGTRSRYQLRSEPCRIGSFGVLTEGKDGFFDVGSAGVSS
jgi:hypothetical protein